LCHGKCQSEHCPWLVEHHANCAARGDGDQTGAVIGIRRRRSACNSSGAVGNIRGEETVVVYRNLWYQQLLALALRLLLVLALVLAAVRLLAALHLLLVQGAGASTALPLACRNAAKPSALFMLTSIAAVAEDQ
jgi:hypothetical protein